MRRCQPRHAVPGILILLLTACDTTDPRVPTLLQLDESSVTLEVGETVAVTARILDQDDREMSPGPEGYEVVWEGSNQAVVGVQGGVITATGPGTATVTARAGDLEPARVEVAVLPPVLQASLRFEYAGDREGTFDVASSFRVDPSGGPDADDWVLSIYHPQLDEHDLVARKLREGNLVDGLLVWVEGLVTEPGTHEVAAGGLVLGLNPATNSAEATYEMQEGTITFSSVSSLDVEGTFEITFVDEDGNVIEATNGTFDAPVFLSGPLQAGGAAAPDLRDRIGGRAFPY